MHSKDLTPGLRVAVNTGYGRAMIHDQHLVEAVVADKPRRGHVVVRYASPLLGHDRTITTDHVQTRDVLGTWEDHLAARERADAAAVASRERREGILRGRAAAQDTLRSLLPPPAVKALPGGLVDQDARLTARTWDNNGILGGTTLGSTTAEQWAAAVQAAYDAGYAAARAEERGEA